MSRTTRVLPVDPLKIGKIVLNDSSNLPLDQWDLHLSNESQDAAHLREAAKELRNSDVPVAFPTETVYGLGADATRSSAVKGIYAAKQRPSDNPLIVHISSLQQLRGLLRPKGKGAVRMANGDGKQTVPNDSTAVSQSQPHNDVELADPIPDIYKPLIQKFWPGPLTLIMPKPENSVLVPEVTAGLDTFGARMPRNLLALTLIKLANVPVAAPSANASTRPSPTAAEHVKHDLDGRIDIILDGGPCHVGVESTVVDGLSSPPSILRPGGISIDQLRQCPGWEHTVIGYKDVAERGMQPKAPGMKYRHYSPKATVVLYECGTQQPTRHEMLERLSNPEAIGVIQTRSWGRNSVAQGKGQITTPAADGQIKENGIFPLVARGDTKSAHETGVPDTLSSPSTPSRRRQPSPASSTQPGLQANDNCFTDTDDDDLQKSLKSPAATAGVLNLLSSLTHHKKLRARKTTAIWNSTDEVETWTIDLGPDIESVARGLFSALRELDLKHVQAIFVEGIDENEGDLAAAVMNRLRKAAKMNIQP